MLVRHRTHNAAHCQAVEIVVNKDQHTQRNGCQLCANPGMDLSSGPAPKSSRTACTVHQAHHGAQNHQEHQNAHIVAVREDLDNTALQHMVHGSLKTEIRSKNRAHQNADKQGAVHLFGNQRQSDGDNRGHQCPKSSIQRRQRCLSLSFCRKDRHTEQHCYHQHQHCRREDSAFG